jgi:hypothetical protein
MWKFLTMMAAALAIATSSAQAGSEELSLEWIAACTAARNVFNESNGGWPARNTRLCEADYFYLLKKRIAEGVNVAEWFKTDLEKLRDQAAAEGRR